MSATGRQGAAAPAGNGGARQPLQQLLGKEREMLAKRIADAPALWMSIPMWGRVFRLAGRVLPLEQADRGRR